MEGQAVHGLYLYSALEVLAKARHHLLKHADLPPGGQHVVPFVVDVKNLWDARWLNLTLRLSISGTHSIASIRSLVRLRIQYSLRIYLQGAFGIEVDRNDAFGAGDALRLEIGLRFQRLLRTHVLNEVAEGTVKIPFLAQQAVGRGGVGNLSRDCFESFVILWEEVRC